MKNVTERLDTAKVLTSAALLTYMVAGKDLGNTLSTKVGGVNYEDAGLDLVLASINKRLTEVGR